ncbi:MAG: deoxyguanosinetriphosphate triphosphohydrolase [Solirubrobacteraceae bacterium]
MGTATASDQLAASFAARWERHERDRLSPLAARSYPAIRKVSEPDCGLRTPFQRDRDRIVHCKAFRRLSHKTQVFIAPTGDHYRTRLTHTLEVTSISRTVARALRLNEDLTEAIGLGHDLGHAPFGHIGEEVLDRCLRERFGGGFRHYEHSLRIVEELERDGRGLNLTAQVRDGILKHSSGAPQPETLEGGIVRIIDRVAYVNHDIDDALRAGILDEQDLPADAIATLGASGSTRIDALVHDMVERSALAGEILQGEEAGEAMARLREFMFEHVYLGPAVRAERERIAEVIGALFNHYVTHPEQLPPARGAGSEGPVAGDEDASEAALPPAPGAKSQDASEAALARRVTDYLAGMTDRFCITAYTALKVPRAFAR